MALSEVRTFFNSRMTEVDSDFKEWTDAFNLENIPSTFYNKAYHLSYGDILDSGLGGVIQQVSFNVVLRAGFKGYRNMSESLDDAMDLMESVVENVQEPANRLGSVLKNVKFESMNVDQSFISNDNLILITQNYNVIYFFNSGG